MVCILNEKRSQVSHSILMPVDDDPEVWVTFMHSSDATKKNIAEAKATQSKISSQLKTFSESLDCGSSALGEDIMAEQSENLSSSDIQQNRSPVSPSARFNSRLWPLVAKTLRLSEEFREELRDRFNFFPRPTHKFGYRSEREDENSEWVEFRNRTHSTMKASKVKESASNQTYISHTNDS